MPEIVGIHGIAQQYRGPYQLADVWLAGIRDGLFAAGHNDTARVLSQEDLRVAFFGNLFRRPGTMAATDPPFTASDIRPGPERDLLTALYDATVAGDPALGEPAGAMGAGVASVPRCGLPGGRRPAGTRGGLRGFQNSAAGPDLGFYAARSYSSIRPPRTDRRLIRSLAGFATVWSGRPELRAAVRSLPVVVGLVKSSAAWARPSKSAG